MIKTKPGKVPQVLFHNFQFSSPIRVKFFAKSIINFYSVMRYTFA